jgi:hypothetical protein
MDFVGELPYAAQPINLLWRRQLIQICIFPINVLVVFVIAFVFAIHQIAVFVAVFRIGRENVKSKTGAVAPRDGTSPESSRFARFLNPMDQVAFVFLPAMNATNPRRNRGRSKRVILCRWAQIHMNNIPPASAISIRL